MTEERRPDDPQSPDAGPPSEPIDQAGVAPPPPPPSLEETSSMATPAPAQPTYEPQPASPPPPSVPPPSVPPRAVPPPAVPPPASVPPPGAQPAVSWAPATAPVAAAGQRTGLALGAGILLIILGILGALIGLGVAVLGRAIIESIGDLGTIPGMEGMDAEAFVSGFMLFFGIIVIVYSLAYLIAGIGVLRSRDWGRILGIIVGILSGLLWLGGLGGAGQAGAGNDIGGTVILLAIHVYIVVALAFFWRSKPASA